MAAGLAEVPGIEGLQIAHKWLADLLVHFSKDVTAYSAVRLVSSLIWWQGNAAQMPSTEIKCFDTEQERRRKSKKRITLDHQRGKCYCPTCFCWLRTPHKHVLSACQRDGLSRADAAVILQHRFICLTSAEASAKLFADLC